jgi:hypothetical protein
MPELEVLIWRDALPDTELKARTSSIAKSSKTRTG